MTLSGRSCGRGVGWRNLHGEISEKVKGLLNRRSRKNLGFATPAEVFLDNHWEKILRFSVECVHLRFEQLSMIIIPHLKF